MFSLEGPTGKRFLTRSRVYEENEINELLKNKHVFPIELGRSIGWESYLGRITKTFSVDSFGESAPIEDLEKNFGFDVPSITKEIIKYLN